MRLSRIATRRLQRTRSSSSSWTHLLPVRSGNLSTSQVSSVFPYSFPSLIVLSCLPSVVSKGNGAHLLKAGSKRRRTQAEIKDQLEKKELEDELNRENAKKAQEQSERIAALE